MSDPCCECVTGFCGLLFCCFGVTSLCDPTGHFGCCSRRRKDDDEELEMQDAEFKDVARESRFAPKPWKRKNKEDEAFVEQVTREAELVQSGQTEQGQEGSGPRTSASAQRSSDGPRHARTSSATKDGDRAIVGTQPAPTPSMEHARKVSNGSPPGA